MTSPPIAPPQDAAAPRTDVDLLRAGTSVNGDRLDNRIENLAVLSRAEHTRLHMSGVKKRRWAQAEIERARELRRLGFTIQQVATLVGRPFSSTRRWLSQTGGGSGGTALAARP